MMCVWKFVHGGCESQSDPIACMDSGTACANEQVNGARARDHNANKGANGQGDVHDKNKMRKRAGKQKTNDRKKPRRVRIAAVPKGSSGAA